MEIKATTKYTEKLTKEFLSFSTQKGKNYKAKRKAYLAIGPILMILIACELIYVAVALEIDELFWLIFTMFFGVAFVWAFPSFVIPAIYFKNMKKIINTENEYIFHDYEFHMSSSNTEYSGTSTMKYTMLYKVYETTDCFYLFINMSNAYLIEKSGIFDGTSDQIRNVISSNLPPKKYIICK